MVGRTGVPLRFAAQQRGPQAQTWGCARASGPVVGRTGRGGRDRAPRLSPLGSYATRRWTRARQTPRACVNCSVASATLRLIALTETPSGAASSAIRQVTRSGENALGASNRFMARRRFQSSPSAPLRTIGGSSRRHSSRAKSFESRPKRVRRARAPDDRCRSVTYVTAPLGKA
jgi:hypothetical protein